MIVRVVALAFFFALYVVCSKCDIFDSYDALGNPNKVRDNKCFSKAHVYIFTSVHFSY
jgi:hypothetical protein